MGGTSPPCILLLVIFGVAAYLLWGLFPAYFPFLLPAQPVEILAHRIIWTALVMAVVVTWRKGWSSLTCATPKTWLLVTAAACVIAINWLIYVIAVTTGHVTESALGYFMNPLVNVALGMIFLQESLRRAQAAAVGLAIIAVVYMTIATGTPPLMGLALAFSFAFYGLIKKKVQLPATESLAAETIVLMPVAGGYLLWMVSQGQSSFTGHGSSHSLLLMSTGIVTAVPLLLFGVGAKKIPLSTMGMLQYLAPTIQMLWAVCIVHEPVSPVKWIGFVTIWVAVVIYLGDVAVRRRTLARKLTKLSMHTQSQAEEKRREPKHSAAGINNGADTETTPDGIGG